MLYANCQNDSTTEIEILVEGDFAKFDFMMSIERISFTATLRLRPIWILIQYKDVILLV